MPKLVRLRGLVGEMWLAPRAVRAIWSPADGHLPFPTGANTAILLKGGFVAFSPDLPGEVAAQLHFGKDAPREKS